MNNTPETDKAKCKFTSLFADNEDAYWVHLTVARKLERERDEARERVKELTYENENLYRRLESVHEVYRLSSVCRAMKAENEQLKQQQQ